MEWQVRIGILLLAALAGCDRSQPKTATPPSPASAAENLAIAQGLVQRGDLAGASDQIQKVLISEPNNVAALELAGDVALLGRNSQRAIEFFELAVAASEHPSRSLFDKIAQEWMNLGRPFKATESATRACVRRPNDPDLRQKLVGLLATLGLQQEAEPHLRWLVQRGHGGLNLLIILSDRARPQTVESICEYALKSYPDDLRPQFSLATLSAHYSKWDVALEQLKPVIDKHPDFVAAQALYGRTIVELGDRAAIQQWSAALPADIQNHPQYWLAAGVWAQRNDDPERAAHAFWRAVLLDENDSESLNHLAASLALLGRLDESKAIAGRAGKIAALRDAIDALMSWNNNSQSAAVKIARILDDLGRHWEATTWLQAAFAMTQSKDPQLAEEYKTIRDKLTGSTPWQLPESLVAAKIDLSTLPDVDWNQQQATAPTVTIAESKTDFRFSDQAAERKLDHVCKIGKPPGAEAGLAIYQSGAGGAGVIDFDCDGWPDVCLTNINGDPLKTNSDSNRLFRNAAGQFSDVTTPAATIDHGFAQGIAVGDYNADGFPDLLFGNIGQNHLFRNNGDGTFTDVTQHSGLSAHDWTTSVVVADIDGDGHADLFEAGYCGGGQPYQQDCIDKELGQPRSCSPLAFDAQRDRVWRGRGDGTFVDATDDWLGEHDWGRGLGLIVGQLDPEPGLDLFVANDMSANHFWSRDSDRDDAFRLVEQAHVRGLALNVRSQSQASMGIAAGDADGDGDLDFFLTHFFDDYNTFYEQVSAGIWVDRSNRVGLAAPSNSMLGYGTQWIDADSDGSPELFIANGDIDDFSHKDRSFRQPVQFFDRRSDGLWVQLPREPLGKYFGKHRLARSVVTLDANRDAHTDLLVTHLFDPVALLVNETVTDTKQIRFFVRGASTHPDAIGTTITLDAGGRMLTQQLLAGNGFQCSSERCLTFGVGDARQVANVTVTWPNGRSESLGSLDTAQDYLIVDGSGEAFTLSP